MYREIFSLEEYPLPPKQSPMHITADGLFIGDVMLNRENCSTYDGCDLLVLRDQKMILKSLMRCVKMNWMSILVLYFMCFLQNLRGVFFYYIEFNITDRWFGLREEQRCSSTRWSDGSEAEVNRHEFRDGHNGNTGWL